MRNVCVQSLNIFMYYAGLQHTYVCGSLVQHDKGVLLLGAKSLAPFCATLLSTNFLETKNNCVCVWFNYLYLYVS